MSISSLQKVLQIKCLSYRPRIFGSFDTPSTFVLDTLKSICAKFGAFFQSLTIFPSNQSTWRHVKIPAHPHDFAAPLPKFLLPLTIPPATQAVTKCVKIDPTLFPGFSPLWRSKSDNPGNEVESTMNLSRGRRGEGGIAIYGLYRHVPLWGVWFSNRHTV